MTTKPELKNFRTAQAYLESSYNSELGSEFGDLFGHKDETREAKIQRSKEAEHDAVCCLLMRIGLDVEISDDEDLKQAIERIQKMPEAQSPKHQHYLAGAWAWVKRGRMIIVDNTVMSRDAA